MGVSRFMPLIAALAILAGCAPTESQVAWQDSRETAPPLSGAGAGMEWRQMTWRDERGVIPEDGWSEAAAHYVANQRLQLSDRSRRPAFPPANGFKWQERGPNNIAGRMRSLLIHPNDPNRMWAGSVSGGVWESIDGGQNWRTIFDDQPVLTASSMAMDPVDPNVMYVGTGEGYFNSDAIRGSGIFVTRDGGVSWEILSATESWAYVQRIAIDPTDRDRILATTRSPGGVWLSTDRGATWSRKLNVTSGVDVEFNPNDSSKAVATALINGNAYRAYYSEDGGESWTPASGTMNQVPGWLSRTELTYAPSDPSIVYALSSTGSTADVHKSTDGGKTYALADEGAVSDSNWYMNDLFVNPNDPNELLFTGVYIYRSMDGGQNVTRIARGYILTTEPHPDVHKVTPLPGHDGVNNQTVFFSTDGGTWRADNVWADDVNDIVYTPLNDDAITTQYYGGDGYGPTDFLMGGTQDNGTHIVRGKSMVGELRYGGDGGWTEIDPTLPENIYWETQWGVLYNDHPVHGFRRLSSGISDSGSSGRINFIPPFALDGRNPENFYLGARSLWRSTNVNTDDPTFKTIYTGSTNVSAIGIAPSNSNVVYVGLNNGRIAKTNNALAPTPVFEDIDDNGSTNPLPNRYVTRIVVHPRHPERLFALFGGFSSQNLWKSKDGGDTWEAITGSNGYTLPAAPLRGLAWDPTDSRKLYVGSEVGVYASDDGGTTWKASMTGPRFVSVDELEFMERSQRLLAGTHGRGLWTLELGGFRPGVLWNETDGTPTVWEMLNGSLGASYPTAEAKGATVPVELNGDGYDDLLVFDPDELRWEVWMMRDGQATVTRTLRNGDDWVVAAVHDMDRDGIEDILWRRPSDDTFVMWLMNGAGAKQQRSFGPRPGWIPTFGDVSGNRRSDIVWKLPDGHVLLWRMDGVDKVEQKIVAWDPNWEVHLVNVDGDRDDDVLLHDPTDGDYVVLIMHNSLRQDARYLGRFPGREVVGISDMDRDDREDIVLREESNGRIHVWLMNGKFRKSTGSPGMAPDATLLLKDFDDDRIDDLLIWNDTTGHVDLWTLSGFGRKGTFRVGTKSPADASGFTAGNW